MIYKLVEKSSMIRDRSSRNFLSKIKTFSKFGITILLQILYDIRYPKVQTKEIMAVIYTDILNIKICCIQIVGTATFDIMNHRDIRVTFYGLQLGKCTVKYVGRKNLVFEEVRVNVVTLCRRICSFPLLKYAIQIRYKSQS